MTRRLAPARLAGLLAVLALLVAALVVGTRGGPEPEAAAPGVGQDPAFAAARTAAALPACPAGLSPELPDLRLSCYAGGPDVTARAAPGRPLLVNLWATWCGPCTEEVPALVQFAREAGDRVGVVGVVVADSPASVYAFAQAFAVPYALVDDPLRELQRRYGSAVPQTLLVTADGRVAHVERGPFADLAEIEAAVSTHLGVRL